VITMLRTSKLFTRRARIGTTSSWPVSFTLTVVPWKSRIVKSRGRMPRTSGPSKPPVDPELRMFTVSLVRHPGVRLSIAAWTAEIMSVPVNTAPPLTRAVHVRGRFIRMPSLIRVTTQKSDEQMTVRRTSRVSAERTMSAGAAESQASSRVADGRGADSKPLSTSAEGTSKPV
jgi:hypothetical protein